MDRCWCGAPWCSHGSRPYVPPAQRLLGIPVRVDPEIPKGTFKLALTAPPYHLGPTCYNMFEEEEDEG